MQTQQRPRPVNPRVRTPEPGTVNARAIRLRTPGYIGQTQQTFADAIGVPVKTLRNWEQQRRQPTGPARVLLSLVARNPWLVYDQQAAHADNTAQQQRPRAPFNLGGQ